MSSTHGPDAFNETRWRRVGATTEQILILGHEHVIRSYEDRCRANIAMASVPDDELLATLTVVTPDVVDHGPPVESDPTSVPPVRVRRQRSKTTLDLGEGSDAESV